MAQEAWRLPGRRGNSEQQLHDLQLHAIALEMENEQLYRARYEIESALEQYTDLYHFAPTAYFTLERDGTIQQANVTGAHLLGLERARLVDACFESFVSVNSRGAFNGFLARVFTCRSTESCDVAIAQKATDDRWVHMEGTRSADGASCRAVVVDITDRKHAEEALQASEARFYALVQSANDAIIVFDDDAKIALWNKGAERLYLWEAQEVLGKSFTITMPESQRAGWTGEIDRMWASRLTWASDKPTDTCGVRRDDSLFQAEISFGAWQGTKNRFYSAIVRDVSARKRADEQLRYQATLLANVNDAIVAFDAEHRITAWNAAAESLFGWRADEVLGQDGLEILGSEWPEGDPDEVRRQIAEVGSWRGESTELCKSGTRIHVEASSVVLRDEDGTITGYVSVHRDISERKRRERELLVVAAVSNALRSASTRAEMLPVILDEVLKLVEADGVALSMLDLGSGDTIIQHARGVLAGGQGTRLERGEGIAGAVSASGEPFVTEDIRKEPMVARPEAFEAVRAVVCVPLVVQTQVIGALWLGRQSAFSPDEVRLFTAIADIAANAIERETSREQTLQQVQRLSALRTIDAAISSSCDLRVTLNVILEHATAQLMVDAAAVLLLNPHMLTLEYAAGRGFRDRAVEQVRVRLGEGQAGRVALERCSLSFPDLAVHSGRGHGSLILREGFVAHHLTPLVAKGQVKGVLEVFQRARFYPDPDWLNFFETLAGQLAIAIDDAQLFEGMQRSNFELSLAYDATIEGWSHALDLRDKKTEGHTRRVTELTVRLAREAGMSDADVVHVRRGALLHDMGKLGVPDSILLKCDRLSEDEWILMRQHPQAAYDMLFPIAYLRPALDIPYCHHEKWDGTGYPRGLKGEDIPLAARLFAVVDVWDALRSDRPYMAACPEEEALEQIRAGIGKHFDPRAAELFFRVIGERTRR